MTAIVRLKLDFVGCWMLAGSQAAAYIVWDWVDSFHLYLGHLAASRPILEMKVAVVEIAQVYTATEAVIEPVSEQVGFEQQAGRQS